MEIVKLISLEVYPLILTSVNTDTGPGRQAQSVALLALEPEVQGSISSQAVYCPEE